MTKIEYTQYGRWNIIIPIAPTKMHLHLDTQMIN